MAKRAEEKERRRRQGASPPEEAARKAAARKRTLLLGGGVSRASSSSASMAASCSAGGEQLGSDSADARPSQTDATAAGCTFKYFAGGAHPHDEQGHLKTNPPTSGNHNPTPAEDGIYAKGNSPAKENFVHSLEHGRIEFQYKPVRARGRHRQAAQPRRGVAQGQLRLPRADVREQHEHAGQVRGDRVDAARSPAPTLDTQSIDAMRAFRKAFTDKGPELIP